MLFERTSDFAGTPEQYWGLLANTDSLNREAGLPEVAYEFTPHADGTVHTRASARKYGMTLRWHELPFEWVEAQGYSVERRFENGPFRTIHGGARLDPIAGGTRITIFADIEPSGLVGRFAAAPFAHKELGGILDICRTWEHFLAGRTEDPYPRRAGQAQVNEAALVEGLAALARAPVPAAAGERLAHHLRTAPEEQVARMRPFELADAWRMDRREVLRTMLYATRCGLLELAYAVLCTACRGSRALVRSMDGLTREAHCDT